MNETGEETRDAEYATEERHERDRRKKKRKTTNTEDAVKWWEGEEDKG